MADRRDPMVAAAAVVAGIPALACTRGDARATVGRLRSVPGGTNVIASAVEFWLDARAGDDAVTQALVADVAETARAAARRTGAPSR